MAGKTEQVVEKNYKIQIAGELWNVPEVRFERKPNNKLMLPKAEIDRINSSIANHICSTQEELNWEQFDFLCKVTITKYIEIANKFRLDKSTVSKWKKVKIDYLTSIVLKQFFWQKIFDKHLQEEGRSVRTDFGEQLENMGDLAIKRHWADNIEPAA